MKNQTCIQKHLGLTIALAFTFCGNMAYAQTLPISLEGSGHSGGGQVTESDFRAYMAKIDIYLQTEEGKRIFPEIVKYDEAHPTETFHQLLINTKPSVKPGKLLDQNGQERDCMSYANHEGRYFICNSDALPEKTLDNQPSFYRIVLHELLVQAGIEKPISKAVPSDYTVSYRITENVHLETYQEWVPGKKVESDYHWEDEHTCKVNLVSFGRYSSDEEVLAVLQDRNYEVVTTESVFKLKLKYSTAEASKPRIFKSENFGSFVPNRLHDLVYLVPSVELFQQSTTYQFILGRAYLSDFRLPNELVNKAATQKRNSILATLKKLKQCKPGASSSKSYEF